MPVYPMPRLVRYAAFMGMDLLELDVPASWGQQALKYARKHDLEKALLEEAFASTSAIETFRASLGIEGTKGVVNMLLGGAGAAKIKITFGITRLPEKLLELQAELQGMRRHMMAGRLPGGVEGSPHFEAPGAHARQLALPNWRTS